jgi:hypothetical protein
MPTDKPNGKKKKRALQSALIYAKDQPLNPRKIPSDMQGTRLLISVGETHLEALRSVTREWLVPRLVDKFLRTHGIHLKYSRNLAREASQLSRSLTGEDRSASVTTSGRIGNRKLQNASKQEKPIRSALVGGHGKS